MGVTVHGRKNQAIEKRPQPLGDKTAGEGARITHHCHDIVVLEQRERRSIGIQPGNRRHTQASHEIVFKYGRIGAHFAVGRVQVDVTGAAIIAGYVGKNLGQVALFRC
ncbi:hypothetical protein D3C85_1033940 [compost metagenome]